MRKRAARFENAHRQTTRKVELPFGPLNILDRDFLPLWFNEQNQKSAEEEVTELDMLEFYFDLPIKNRIAYAMSKVGSLERFYNQSTKEQGDKLGYLHDVLNSEFQHLLRTEKFAQKRTIRLFSYEEERHYLRTTFAFLDGLYPGDHTEREGHVTSFSKMNFPDALWQSLSEGKFGETLYSFLDEIIKTSGGGLTILHHSLSIHLEEGK